MGRNYPRKETSYFKENKLRLRFPRKEEGLFTILGRLARWGWIGLRPGLNFSYSIIQGN